MSFLPAIVKPGKAFRVGRIRGNAGRLLSHRTVRIEKSTRKPGNWKVKSEQKIGNVFSLSASVSVLIGTVWGFCFVWGYFCLFCFCIPPRWLHSICSFSTYLLSFYCGSTLLNTEDMIKAKAVPSRACILEINKYVHAMFYIMSDSDNALEKNTASEE